MPALNSLIVNPIPPGDPLDPSNHHYAPNPPDPSGPPVAEDQIIPFLDDLPRLYIEDLTSHGDGAERRIVLRRKVVKLHKNLLETPVWSYDIQHYGHWVTDNQYVGPALTVRRGQKVEITFDNRLGGSLPVRAYARDVGDPTDNVKDVTTANTPGHEDSVPYPHADELYGAAVTHLHGGRTAAMYDGWTENVMLPPRTEAGTDEAGVTRTIYRRGETQVSVYENDQRATMLWYHDHLMGATRFTVHAGLASAYFIRDEDDPGAETPGATTATNTLGIVFPAGPYEVPLIIKDRNLDGDPDPDAPRVLLNGRLMHKVTNNTAEFFGPYTLVNGVIWPKMAAERRRYRFRILNGSNARTFCLKLVSITFDAAGLPVLGAEVPMGDFLRQIGTDGGLLARPVNLPDGTPPPGLPGDTPVTDGLILASAERADIIVDFARVPPGITHLALVNTAFAPFHQFTIQHPDPSLGELNPITNQPVDPAPAGTAAFGMRLSKPWVMCFELGATAGEDTTTDLIADDVELVDPATLGPSSHSDLDVPDGETPHGHRLVALIEHPTGMLMLNELAPVPASGLPLPPAAARITIDEASGNPGSPKDYVPVARLFEDQVNFFVPYGKVEVWKFLNLSGDTHPIHIHLVQFKILSRTQFDPGSFDPAGGGTTPGGAPVKNSGPGYVDDNEKGWKDTVRVNPNEMVSVAARFDGFSGRYMYHCHIIEHEDHEMMRPFVVVPGPTMLLMADMPMMDGTEDGMGGMGGTNMGGMG